ncbi:ArsR/SmtB family transcription factor [Texcoconibacillus texcoconensis]|uniref:ArsR family transcriptional regulator n=1 Tax=Texcoconibacillus texcoconensis TaxID=1095777 RepID=A0A840QSL4_9BACI|nr:metalloregulator ArsR/SmtB family transcription factor [Texcoconibacillus texcoconensis]MBB5174354.1 ArsR family transcriptional regulator [Texcoconibacillus texcoconensis]
MTNQTTFIDVASVLKLLSDKTRLQMLALLQIDECCVCEFVEFFQMSQPSISQHLRKLRDARVVHEERRGQWVYYSLNLSHPQVELINNILNQCPSQIAAIETWNASGNRVKCATNILAGSKEK